MPEKRLDSGLAIFLVNEAAKKLTTKTEIGSRPVNWLISDCNWPAAIAAIDSVITDLKRAQIALRDIRDKG